MAKLKQVLSKVKAKVQKKATQILDDMDGTTYAKNTTKRMTPTMKKNMEYMKSSNKKK